MDVGVRRAPAAEEREGLMLRSAALVCSVAFALLPVLGGCGGGGGGGMVGGVPPPPADPDPPSADRVPPPAARPAALQALAGPYESDAEYGNAWGLRQIDAATAYARIARRDGAGTAPGAGARVAVIDDGIDIDHWEFEPRRIGMTDPSGAVADPSPGNPPPTDPDPPSIVGRHGTAVASVIVARRDGPVPSEHARARLPRRRLGRRPPPQ